MRYGLIIGSLFVFLLIGCSTLELTPSNFAWPVETVLDVDEKGQVSLERYSFSFSAKNLFLEEFEDSLAYSEKQIRIIGDNAGYYYITGEEFKNVYVFSRGEGSLVLENRIFITESGLISPAMNQRNPYIELVTKEFKYYINNEGITRIE